MGFERRRYLRVQLPPRAAKQGALRGILHECVLEQESGLRWHPTLKHKTGVDQPAHCIPELRLSALVYYAQQFVRELRPIAAPICAISFAADPTRSSRAINDACSVAGTASDVECVAVI